MSQQEKRRLYIIGAILLAAVILLLLFGKRAVAGAGSTVVNNQGSEFTFPGIDPVQLTDLPPLDIPGSRASSRGCAVCYSGYGRIVAPAIAPAPAPVIEQINYYLTSVVTRPTPPPAPLPRAAAVAFNSSPPAPRPWWEGCTAGRCF